MNQSYLNTETIEVKQLIEKYRKGIVVIPEFQRDYIWKQKAASDLVDSLYKQYPISSILLWQSMEEVRTRRKDPRRSRGYNVSWLIDGQQRVMSLAKTWEGDDIDVVFNPETEEFRLAKKKDGPNWFHVSDLWDEDTYFDVIQKHLGGTLQKQNLLKSRLERVRDILKYKIPVVTMVDYEFKDAVLAFTRINTCGVRLKTEDVESAKIAARHIGFIADEVVPFLEGLRQDGFSRLNVMHLFHVCAFVASSDQRGTVKLHQLKTEDVRSAWKETKEAVRQAISVVKTELGLVSMDILWSGTLLVPLIALCEKIPARERNSQAFVAWLALAALSHRYSGSTSTKLEEDLKACQTVDPIGGLLKNLRADRPSLLATANDFSGALNDKNGLLAMYIACKHRDIQDFTENGGKILIHNIHRHHILPRAQFPEKDRGKVDNVANISFISGDVNESIYMSGPEVYLKTIKPRVLQSQCVPVEQALWLIDRAEPFWKARKGLLAEAFNEFIKEALPGRKLRG